MSLLPILLLCAGPASAQQWTADVYVGGTRYDALASVASAANLVGNIRVESARFFAYLSAAAPLEGESPVWSALGAGTRLRRSLGRARVGLDLGADAYAFRNPVLSGQGLTTHVLPMVGITGGRFDLQVQGGRRDHHAGGEAGPSSRHLYEAGARATVGSDPAYGVADVRVFGTGQKTYPRAQLQVGTAFGAARVWGSAGRWFGSDLEETVWSAGASFAVNARGEIWAGVRHDVDPLYASPSRTTWNVGYSMKLGRVERVLPAPEIRDGRIIVRLERRHAPAPPSVAGEFSDWQPLPMSAAGSDWVIEIPAQSGVYRFAFVSEAGEWFVPEGYPGRMDDDMGGYVAVVVVP